MIRGMKRRVILKESMLRESSYSGIKNMRSCPTD
jgi:hypothetical protein